MITNSDIAKATETYIGTIFEELPPKPEFAPGIRRAPARHFNLSPKDTELALKNALRYIPEKWHEALAPEFLGELTMRGRIYGYRFRPAGPIKGRPVDAYNGRCIEGKAFQVMIDNNLDFDVALYPYELVTYGETGQVCQNWMQYRLIKRYLEVLTREQTLVMASGHPLGLFASSPEAPRVIITNALMVGCFDDPDNWHRAMALGVANYGQMTAGGWMYIGPQGIVHGTYSTILNAGRAKLGIPADQDLAGRLFVTSGLGGMSGAQGKAVVIANGVVEKCLGMELFVQPDVSRHTIKDDDVLILCTDGVWAYVEDDEFAEITLEKRVPEQISQALIETALIRDSDDNVSALVIHAEQLTLSPARHENNRFSLTQFILGHLTGKTS